MKCAYLNEVELKPIASRTITDLEQLQTVLLESGKTGYSISYSELYDHTYAVGAPSFNLSGHLTAVISIVDPESRFQEDRIPSLIKEAKTPANEIS